MTRMCLRCWGKGRYRVMSAVSETMIPRKCERCNGTGKEQKAKP